MAIGFSITSPFHAHAWPRLELTARDDMLEVDGDKDGDDTEQMEWYGEGRRERERKRQGEYKRILKWERKYATDCHDSMHIGAFLVLIVFLLFFCW